MNSIILILGRSRNSGANAPVGTTFTRKMIKKNVLHNELQVKNDICNSLACLLQGSMIRIISVIRKISEHFTLC